MREINAVWPQRPLTDMFQLTTSVLNAGAQRITAQLETRRRLFRAPHGMVLVQGFTTSLTQRGAFLHLP
jgi:hypothetical protein